MTLRTRPNRTSARHGPAVSLREHLRALGQVTASALATFRRRAAAAAEARRRRNLQRQTARELHALDDRTLADIGVPRSHIWWIAEHLVTAATSTQSLRASRLDPRPKAPKPKAGPAVAQGRAAVSAIIRRNESRGQASPAPALAGCG